MALKLQPWSIDETECNCDTVQYTRVPTEHVYSCTWLQFALPYVKYVRPSVRPFVWTALPFVKSFSTYTDRSCIQIGRKNFKKDGDCSFVPLRKGRILLHRGSRNPHTFLAGFYSSRSKECGYCEEEFFIWNIAVPVSITKFQKISSHNQTTIMNELIKRRRIPKSVLFVIGDFVMFWLWVEIFLCFGCEWRLCYVLVVIGDFVMFWLWVEILLCFGCDWRFCYVLVVSGDFVMFWLWVEILLYFGCDWRFCYVLVVSGDFVMFWLWVEILLCFGCEWRFCYVLVVIGDFVMFWLWVEILLCFGCEWRFCYVFVKRNLPTPRSKAEPSLSPFLQNLKLTGKFC